MQGLGSLELLSVSDSINVFGEDLYALHNLLYQGLPNLKECCLTFQQLIIYFTLLKDAKFESIQELLGILLSGRVNNHRQIVTLLHSNGGTTKQCIPGWRACAAT